jgi:hypothetical protein
MYEQSRLGTETRWVPTGFKLEILYIGREKIGPITDSQAMKVTKISYVENDMLPPNAPHTKSGIIMNQCAS